MVKQTPLIRKTPLTKRWACITRYRSKPDGIIIAHEQFDVDDQVREIIRQEKAATRKRQKGKARVTTQ